MSILSICSSACMTRLDFAASWLCNSSASAVGVICHDTPNLSFSQPQRLFSPPAESCSHSLSTSACVSQLTTNEMASVNLKCGPPFNAVNCCPSSSKAMVITDPLGLPETASPS